MRFWVVVVQLIRRPSDEEGASKQTVPNLRIPPSTVHQWAARQNSARESQVEGGRQGGRILLGRPVVGCANGIDLCMSSWHTTCYEVPRIQVPTQFQPYFTYLVFSSFVLRLCNVEKVSPKRFCRIWTSSGRISKHPNMGLTVNWFCFVAPCICSQHLEFVRSSDSFFGLYRVLPSS